VRTSSYVGYKSMRNLLLKTVSEAHVSSDIVVMHVPKAVNRLVSDNVEIEGAEGVDLCVQEKTCRGRIEPKDEEDGSGSSKHCTAPASEIPGGREGYATKDQHDTTQAQALQRGAEHLRSTAQLVREGSQGEHTLDKPMTIQVAASDDQLTAACPRPRPADLLRSRVHELTMILAAGLHACPFTFALMLPVRAHTHTHVRAG
jgi:hypothetical protein